jgi:hypothetical protein
MKRFVEGLDRGQSTLFPTSLDDYVIEDNPVRAVDVFVDGLDPKYDSNWLVVAGKVTHSRGSWQFTCACLLTYEAARLASWMDAVADANPRSNTCGFTEPNRSAAVMGVERACWERGYLGRVSHRRARPKVGCATMAQ